MDTLKFFSSALDKNVETENSHPSNPVGMTRNEARRRVEDTLGSAIETVAQLEKLQQQRATSLSQPSQRISNSNVSPVFREERKSALEACKEAAFWLTTVKAKIKPTYFYLPAPENKLMAVSAETPTPLPTLSGRSGLRFIPPKLKH